MSATNEIFSDRYFIVCQIEAPGDNVEELVQAFKPMIQFFESGQEPGTLMFRVVHFENKFVVFEQYENLAAQLLHRQSEPYKSLGAFLRSIKAKMDLKYYEGVFQP